MAFQPSNRRTLITSNCRKLYIVNCFNPMEFILKMNFAINAKFGKNSWPCFVFQVSSRNRRIFLVCINTGTQCFPCIGGSRVLLTPPPCHGPITFNYLATTIRIYLYPYWRDSPFLLIDHIYKLTKAIP